jgi:hypothetical protein
MHRSLSAEEEEMHVKVMHSTALPVTVLFMHVMSNYVGTEGPLLNFMAAGTWQSQLVAPFQERNPS